MADLSCVHFLALQSMILNVCVCVLCELCQFRYGYGVGLTQVGENEYLIAF